VVCDRFATVRWLNGVALQRSELWGWSIVLGCDGSSEVLGCPSIGDCRTDMGACVVRRSSSRLLDTGKVVACSGELGGPLRVVGTCQGLRLGLVGVRGLGAFRRHGLGCWWTYSHSDGHRFGVSCSLACWEMAFAARKNLPGLVG
jgi:hypothetical protein